MTVRVRRLPGHRVADEAPGLLPYRTPPPYPPDRRLHTLLALDGAPPAWTRPHGQAISWFG